MSTGQLNWATLILAVCLLASCIILISAADESTSGSSRPKPRVFRSRQQNTLASQSQASSSSVEQPASSGSVVEVASGAAVNRTARTADIFTEGYNLFVTNTCERESMKINIKTNKEFNGIIHTQDFRRKEICSVQGNGAKEYNLEISHVLNQKDPQYCGVIRARKESPEDRDILSVVVAVRIHPSIELSDDKFFLLNCTNRCRKPDCSNASANLIPANDDSSPRPSGNLLNYNESSNGETPSEPNNGNSQTEREDEQCTIWKFPWVITLLWCLGILLLAMMISHCIMCSSMVCKCVKTEVEEREPSVYEGETDLEDERIYNKKHPYRIDYDNKDVYTTQNNYPAYKLDSKSTGHKRRSHR